MMGAASDDVAVEQVRHRARLLLLLDAAERAAITPLASPRLHAFAYLADVLSPVWDLLPYSGKIYKDESRPHYADLQAELDELVVLGLVDISKLKFITRGEAGARVDGFYTLNFASPHLGPLLAALGCDGPEKAIDPADAGLHDFLVELATALATLHDDEIDVAASVDVTFAAPQKLTPELSPVTETGHFWGLVVPLGGDVTDCIGAAASTV
jgi:hypothetical protein